MEERDEFGDEGLAEGPVPWALPSEGGRPAPPAWAVPARRDDDVGRLARRLCAPDFTAGPPLVEAIREREGDAAADELARRLVLMLNRFPASVCAELDADPSADYSVLVVELRRSLRRVCAAYLYDLTSACGVLARVVALAGRTPQPLETGSASVSVVFCRLSPHTTVGERVTLPDGRRGVVVVPRGDDGRGGVMIDGTDGPQTHSQSEGDGPPTFDESAD